MQLNIYRRAERDDAFSYLAVQAGCPIPEEATNTDWEMEAQAIEIDDAADDLPEYAIRYPIEQITAKGYAITNLKNMGYSGRQKKPE